MGSNRRNTAPLQPAECRRPSERPHSAGLPAQACCLSAQAERLSRDFATGPYNKQPLRDSVKKLLRMGGPAVAGLEASLTITLTFF